MTQHKNSLCQTYQNQILNEVWYWNKKPVKLKNLNDFQIKQIRGLIDNPKYKNWHYKSREYWNNTFKSLTKIKQDQYVDEASKYLYARRVDKAQITVDRVINSARIFNHFKFD